MAQRWVADAPPDPKRPSRVKRVAAATLEGALVTALTFGLIAGSAFAGKGGNGGKPGGGGGGSITMVPLDGTANWGDRDTFRDLDLQSIPGRQCDLLPGRLGGLRSFASPVLAERLGRRRHFHPELAGLDRRRCQLHRLPEGHIARPGRDARFYIVLGGTVGTPETSQDKDKAPARRAGASCYLSWMATVE